MISALRELVKHRAQAAQLLAYRCCRIGVSALALREPQRLFEFRDGLYHHPLLFVETAEIHKGIMTWLILGRSLGFFEPLDRLVEFAFCDQICADVVVGIAELGIHFDGALALRNRVIDTSKMTIRPAAKSVGLGGGKRLDGLRVEADRGVEFIDRFAIAFATGQRERARMMVVALAPQLDRPKFLYRRVHY